MNNGASPVEIVDKSEDTIQIIKNTNIFIIDFVSTNGDIPFDFKHKHFFFLKSKNFYLMNLFHVMTK